MLNEVIADIVIYGGSFQAAASAAKAASQAPDARIAVIIPYPVSDQEKAFGSIGTLGGQNFFDIRKVGNVNPCQGSFAWWYSRLGQFYNTEDMAARLTYDVTKYSNVDVYYGYDIYSFQRNLNPYRITCVDIRSIDRNTSTGYIQWGSSTYCITGSVFIDASDDGRLARIANFGGTVGRYDWPASALDADERGSSGKPRQQVATLMFQVTGVDIGSISGDMSLAYSVNANNETVYAVFGGGDTYKNDPIVKRFNENHPGFAIKPLNAAQDGPNSLNWWVNALLVFNVDGRAYERDRGTNIFPPNMRSDYITVDQAWANARNLLSETGSGSFMEALHRFGGFEHAQLVLSDGQPKVGEVLYLRETVHMAIESGNRGNGSGNSNYEVTDYESHRAGTGPTLGDDTGNYNHRIGLNYYWSDINAYKKEDLKNSAGNYIWGSEIALKLRGNDLNTPEHPINGSSPANPVYVPYSALTTNYVANLLIPGYAVGASSYAWAEMRVIPNLCVLGDAAGVAAAYAYNNGKHPLHFSSLDISNVQSILRSVNVQLEKVNNTEH